LCYHFDMKDTKTTPARLSDVDFLISTYDNRFGLERLIVSILDKYPAAKITIADSDENLDRAYYKSLRLELNALNRIIVHHVPYKSSIALAFNRLIDLTTSKYKLLLTDTDAVADETDIEEMIRVMQSNKTIGVVSGHINTKENKKTETREHTTDGGDIFTDTNQVSRFMMVLSDVKNYIRFDEQAKDFALEFSNKSVNRLPFKLVMSGSVIISNEDYVNGEQNGSSDGESAGKTPEQLVPDTTGGSDTEGGSDNTGLLGRKNEASKNPAPRGRQSGGLTGSLQGKGDK